jgi:hypothetical protein
MWSPTRASSEGLTIKKKKIYYCASKILNFVVG